MAFLVLLQRLTGPERAVLLLHDVFDFAYPEIAELTGKTETACRQLLSRARKNVSSTRRCFEVPEEKHLQMLQSFFDASISGDKHKIAKLLSNDVVLIVDGGSEGSNFGRTKNLPRPVMGIQKVSAVLASVTPQGMPGLDTEICKLNGQPAILVLKDTQPIASIILSIEDDYIVSIFIQSDSSRLRNVALKTHLPDLDR